MSPPRSRRTPLDPETLRPRGRHQRALRRKRRRKRARRRGGRAILALAAAAGIGGTAAVLAYGSSCDLDSLRRVDIGAEHVRLRRGRLSARLDPGREEPRARHRSGHVAVDPQGDDRDRGPPLLRARRRRPRGHRAGRRRRHQGRGDRRGRLDDHAAARPQPLHLARADGPAQGEGGVPRHEARRRVVEAADPDRRTSTRSTTATTRTASRQRRRRTSRSPPASSTLSESALLAGLHAGAVDLRPVHRSGPCARAAAGGAPRPCSTPASSRRASTARRSTPRVVFTPRTSLRRGSGSRTSSATSATS